MLSDYLWQTALVLASAATGVALYLYFYKTHRK